MPEPGIILVCKFKEIFLGMAESKMKKFFKTTWELLSGTFTGFLNDRGLKLSAALAYYTLFSIAPLLILIISLASIFFGRDAVNGHVVEQITTLVGKPAAIQIQEMIKSATISGKSYIALTIGAVIVVIGATSTFIEIQDSINIIWGVKVKPKRGWLKLIKDRLLSSSMILGLSFILIASLVVNGFVHALSDSLSRILPNLTIILFKAINLGITFIVITVLFGIIFKFLPDVRIKWKNVRMGALFTACLFMIGQYLIGLYIEFTHQGSTYGAAGSLIVILVWIYYTAAILYLGAEFTRFYSDHYGIKIEPAEYAVFVQEQEIEPDTVDDAPEKLVKAEDAEPLVTKK